MGNVTADQICEFANQQYMGPACAARKPQVTIRSGDVRAAMELVSRMPANAAQSDQRNSAATID
jgi:hypothetical protein